MASLIDGGKQTEFARAIILQAPSGNTLVLNYGDQTAQPMTLASGATSPVILVSNLKTLFVLGGDADDQVVILVSQV